MLAGERKALLRVVDELCAELGYSEGEEEAPGARSAMHGKDAPWGALGPEDESLVAGMRWSLAKVAAAVRGAKPDGGSPAMAEAVLNGIDLVVRGELASGNAERLPSLVPGFVFLVALSIVEQDEALELSRRTSELIEGALRS